MKKSKRYSQLLEKIDSAKEYDLTEAVRVVRESATSKFDETVEIAINLGVDPRHADQNIRGTASLPYGTGKSARVLVLTQGQKEKEAEEAGADYVGLDDYIKKIEGGWFEFDSVVATPDVMSKVGKMGKVLGPRGLMPSPKSGTVTMDVTDTVKAIKGGRIEFRVDKNGILHVGLGKTSFDAEKIEENVKSFVLAVIRLKPASAKGQYIKRLTLSSTMGPGVKVNHQNLLLSLK
ncbi:50S ribosomal protein L1 [candidate division KSB1 bacterium]